MRQDPDKKASDSCICLRKSVSARLKLLYE